MTLNREASDTHTHTQKAETPRSTIYFVRNSSQRSYNYISVIISVSLKLVRTITVTFNSLGSILYLNKICRNVILYSHYTDKFATPLLLPLREMQNKYKHTLQEMYLRIRQWKLK